MKKTVVILLLMFFCCSYYCSHAQLYFTKNGRISFFSKTSLENISADNNQVLSVVNMETGALQFSLLNNAFYFPKAKMQEDFNENYMESDKYPKSNFKGIITNISSVNVSQDANYIIHVKGDLTIHGVTKNINADGNLIIKNGNISATASFKVLLTDYKIKIPTIVTDKIARDIAVTIRCNYEKKL
ncbi:MAG TPA: YceI family protein [Ginsengibacter sp.]|nr:YceI family protein [Ginsengibacter sp.]